MEWEASKAKEKEEELTELSREDEDVVCATLLVCGTKPTTSRESPTTSYILLVLNTGGFFRSRSFLAQPYVRYIICRSM